MGFPATQTESSDLSPPSGERQLFAKAVLRRRRIQILEQMNRQLASGHDPDREVMPALYRALSAERIVDATLGYIVTHQEDGMRLGFMEGFDRAMIERCVRLDFGQAVCGTVAVTRRAMHVTDIQRSLDPLADLVRSAGINAYACEPLLVRGELLGTLSFASRSRRRFDADDLTFFRIIAKHLAMARSSAPYRAGLTTPAVRGPDAAIA